MIKGGCDFVVLFVFIFSVDLCFYKMFLQMFSGKPMGVNVIHISVSYKIFEFIREVLLNVFLINCSCGLKHQNVLITCQGADLGIIF